MEQRNPEVEFIYLTFAGMGYRGVYRKNHEFSTLSDMLNWLTLEHKIFVSIEINFFPVVWRMYSYTTDEGIEEHDMEMIKNLDYLHSCETYEKALMLGLTAVAKMFIEEVNQRYSKNILK